VRRKNHGPGETQLPSSSRVKVDCGQVVDWGYVELARDGPEGRDSKRTFIPVNSFGFFQPSDHGGTYI